MLGKSIIQISPAVGGYNHTFLRHFSNLRNDYFGNSGSSFSSTPYCQLLSLSLSLSENELFILQQPVHSPVPEVRRRICRIIPSHLQYQNKRMQQVVIGWSIFVL